MRRGQRQYENWRRRDAINQDIVALATGGLSIKAIVRKTGHARAIVRQVLRGGRADVFRRPPAARVIARMLTVGRDQLSKMEAITAAIIEKASPALMIARNLMDRFHSLIRTRNGSRAKLDLLRARLIGAS